jgi:hypothetical protein
MLGRRWNLHATHVVCQLVSVDRRADLTLRALRGFQAKPLDVSVNASTLPSKLLRGQSDPAHSLG